MVKEDMEVQAYLPDWSSKHRPDKTYLCNIINSVHKNSIVNMVKKIKLEKSEKRQIEKEDYLDIP